MCACRRLDESITHLHSYSVFASSCYPQALDFLAISVHELASISERRIERLCNPSLSELPAFLVNEGGLNSGFMIAHCTAASLGTCQPPCVSPNNPLNVSIRACLVKLVESQ